MRTAGMAGAWWPARPGHLSRLNFETNSETFYDAVPNFEGFVKSHETLSISVKN